MQKIKTPICLFFCLVFIIMAIAGSVLCAVKVNVLSADTFQTSAKAMCTMEASTGRILYSKNENAKLPMASTTKIMTAITAIENCADLDEKFVISPKAVGISGTSIYLRKDEALSIRELLYGLMLVSGNDASVAIGERVGGNVKNFVELMNKTAEKIGATNSHFANTHGLDEKGHYTSASDLARITSYALQNETFREIVSTKNTKIVNTAGKSRYLKNKNKLLHTLEGCIGVKTGFTDDAGRCLVSSAERDGMTLVCVVLNCGPMFEESATLLEKGFEDYKMIDVTKDYDYSRFVKVEGGRKEFCEVGTKGSFVYPFKSGEQNKLKYLYTLPDFLNSPVNKGEQIGKVEVYYGNDLLFSEKIYTMEEVRGNTVWEKLKDVLTQW